MKSITSVQTVPQMNLQRFSAQGWWIVKSREFDAWFSESLVHLPGSKSIYWRNQRCHQCAHCDVVRTICILRRRSTELRAVTICACVRRYTACILL